MVEYNDNVSDAVALEASSSVDIYRQPQRIILKARVAAAAAAAGLRGPSIRRAGSVGGGRSGRSPHLAERWDNDGDGGWDEQGVERDRQQELGTVRFRQLQPASTGTNGASTFDDTGGCVGG